MNRERKSDRIRSWLKLRRVRIVHLAREIGVTDGLVHGCIDGRNSNRKVLKKLLEIGCPRVYLALPKDLDQAA